MAKGQKVYLDDRDDLIDGIVQGIAASAVVPPNGYASTAVETNHVIKDAAGVVFVASMYNDNAATRYLQFFDSHTLPADGVVPLLSFEVPTKTTRVIDSYAFRGKQFRIGIVVCNSTTGVSKTLGGADCLFDVEYS